MRLFRMIVTFIVLCVPMLAQAVNLNNADAKALSSISGIGPGKAKAIVVYRDKHGPFASVDDVVKVKGIGKKLLANIRGSLTLSDDAMATGKGGK